jgi:hypothetical protein
MFASDPEFAAGPAMEIGLAGSILIAAQQHPAVHHPLDRRACHAI